MTNITQILTELDSYNELYILDRYQKNRMKTVDSNLLNELTSFQKYELLLNQQILYINPYKTLEESITTFEDIKNYNISFNELLAFLTDRLSIKASLDRKYLFHELLLNFCEQKDKQQYSIKVIELLKEVITNKLNTNEWVLILFLYMRFIILSQKFNIIDKEFIANVNNKFIESLEESKDRFSFMAFFRYFFNKFDKKIIYFQNVLDTFNKYTEHLEKHILNNYSPINKYAAAIAESYEKVDYNKKVYFYKKEIDNTLLYFQDIKVGNALIDQTIIKDNLEFSTKIKSYKSKELKEIAIKLADLVSKNHDKIFISQADEELEQIAQEHFNRIKDLYIKQANKEDKIDYLLFCFIHFNYSKEYYEIHKKNDDNKFAEMFFPSVTVTDHLGYIHNVKNKDTFTFFRNTSDLNNQILVVLDNNTNWVDLSTSIILEDITNLKMLEKDQTQYKKAINNFNDGQYMDFMYIAPVLIERMLKNYLIQINGNIKSFRGDSILDKTLNQIIDELKEDENCYLDKYLLRYFAYVLVDNDGLNMRNHISHGNYSDAYFCKNYAMYIYIILIYLIRYFSYDQD